MKNEKQGFGASASEPAHADSTSEDRSLEIGLGYVQDVQNTSSLMPLSTDQIKPPKRPKIAREHKPPKEPKGPTEFYQVWEKYALALADKWGVKLTPAPTALRHCKNLINAIGFENALAVAEFYPSRQKDWYVKHGHDLMWAVKDATLLLGELQTGVKKTQKFVDTVHREEDKKEYESMREKGAYKNILLMTEEEIKEAFPNEIEESTEPILLTKSW